MKSYSNYGQKQFLFAIAAINIEFQCYGKLFEKEETKINRSKFIFFVLRFAFF